MSNTNNLNRTILGLDYKVWLAMFITWLLSLALFGYKRITDKTCMPATITVNDKTGSVIMCKVDNFIKFVIHADSATKVVWDFGDGSNKLSGVVATHRYVKEGTFKVEVTINGNCIYNQEIVVKQHTTNENKKVELNIFSETLAPVEGSSVDFYGVANIPVQSYKWSLFRDHVLITDANIQGNSMATFTFPTPDKYTVKLIIDNDPNLVAVKEVIVTQFEAQAPQFSNPNDPNIGAFPNLGTSEENPFGRRNEQRHENEKPPAKETAEPTVGATKLIIAEESFKNLLQQVINEEKDVKELYEYLHYEESTFIEVNNTPRVKITEFLKNIKSKTSKTIETLNFKRDDKKGIQTIIISIPEKKEKRGLLNRLNPFKKN